MAVVLGNDVAEVVALEQNRAKGISARVEQRLINAPKAKILLRF
jgi:hypothetical protein